MRKAILAGLFALFISVASLAFAGTRFEAAAWQEACEKSRYSCEGLSRPVVEYDETGLEGGLWGYYMLGTRVVFLSTGLKPGQEYAVLVHEMVHYLQYSDYKRHPNVVLDRCTAEREAFEVSDQVLKRLGLPELARNGDLDNYGC